MPKLDLDASPLRTGSIYPEPYASMMAGRSSRRLAQAAGLTQFGANLVILAPGAVASLRHAHALEDELAWVVAGELVLVEDAGETLMGPGDCAAWPAGTGDAHRFENRSSAEARFLVVGPARPDEVVTYPDVDMVLHREGGANRLTYRDGTPWAGPRDRGPR